MLQPPWTSMGGLVLSSMYIEAAAAENRSVKVGEKDNKIKYVDWLANNKK